MGDVGTAGRLEQMNGKRQGNGGMGEGGPGEGEVWGLERAGLARDGGRETDRKDDPR